MIGQRFERLIVTSRAESKFGKRRWNCECDCGNKVVVFSQDLRRGHTKSCGCLARELASMRSAKHQQTGTRLYKIWHNMKQRCENPNNKSYQNYGARGIFICAEWNDFEPFYRWAISHGYNESLTIERIDNNGPYCPENCEWANLKRQARNKRNVPLYHGKSLAEWAEITGLPYERMRGRLRRGLTWEKVIDIKGIKRQEVN